MADTSRRVKSASRVAEILRTLASTNGGMTLADVARELKLPRSSTYALLTDLVTSRLVEEDASSPVRMYRIGVVAFEVGMAFLRQRSLTQEAAAVVEGVAAHFDETAHLAILDGPEVVYVAKAESSHAMRVASAVGARFPAHGTGVGKVLLAFLDPERLGTLYPDAQLPAMTPHTVKSKQQLLAELAKIRDAGYAFDDEESTLGLQCLAVPVCGQAGDCVAALSVSVPTVRMARIDKKDLLDVLLRSSQQLSKQLGWRAPGARPAATIQQ